MHQGSESIFIFRTTILLLMFFWLPKVFVTSNCPQTECCILHQTNAITCKGNITSVPPPPTAGNPRTTGYCSYCRGHLPWNDTSAEEVQSLMLAGSRFTRLSKDTLRNFPKLRKISLSRNSFTALQPDAFHLQGQTSYLTSLSLKDNQISIVDVEAFAGLTNLEVLILTGNKITDLPGEVFNALRKLQYLDLSGNKLQTLNEDIFEKTHELIYIDLSHNTLNNLPAYVFTNLCSLRTLHINHNKLTTAHYQWFASVIDNSDKLKNKVVNPHTISGNPWICGKNMEGFAVFQMTVMKNHDLKDLGLDSYQRIVCRDEANKGRNLTEVLNETNIDAGLIHCLENQNMNSTCRKTKSLMCPFLSSKCSNNTEPRPEPCIVPYKPPKNEGAKIAFIAVIASCPCMALGLIMMYIHKKKRNSGEPSPSHNSKDSINSETKAEMSSVTEPKSFSTETKPLVPTTNPGLLPLSNVPTTNQEHQHPLHWAQNFPQHPPHSHSPDPLRNIQRPVQYKTPTGTRRPRASSYHLYETEIPFGYPRPEPNPNWVPDIFPNPNLIPAVQYLPCHPCQSNGQHVLVPIDDYVKMT